MLKLAQEYRGKSYTQAYARIAQTVRVSVSHAEGLSFESRCVHPKTMSLLKVLLIFTILSIIPGQIIRIPITQNANVTISDTSVFLFVFLFIIHSLAVKKSIKVNTKITSFFIIFSLIAASSNIFALQNFSLKEVVSSSMFLIRFIFYFLLLVAVSNIISKKQAQNWLNVILASCSIFILFGFLQLIFVPDFTILTQYGWDPHQRRLASTFLDPNFAGGLLAIAISIAIPLYFKTKNKFYVLFSFASFIALLLTFSRSSYLAIIASVLTLGFLRSKRLLVAFLIVSALSFVALPGVRTRTIGAIKVDETSQARIESWQKGLEIFKDNYILGVGFNTYRFAQSNYGFFTLDNPQGGHSGSGTDSSLLLVAVTTGIVGLFAFIAVYASVFFTAIKNAKKNTISLAVVSTFFAIFVHSQFVNSLFFPQIMLIYWILFGLLYTHDS